MTEVQNDWFSDGNGYIRRVKMPPDGRIKYVAWKHFMPVLYWFDSVEEAKIAYDQQEMIVPVFPELIPITKPEPICEELLVKAASQIGLEEVIENL